MLQSMGLQRVRHDLETEQQQIESQLFGYHLCVLGQVTPHLRASVSSDGDNGSSQISTYVHSLKSFVIKHLTQGLVHSTHQ